MSLLSTMNNKNTELFNKLWKLDWGVGIFYKSVKKLSNYVLIEGYIPHEYFNFILPSSSNVSAAELTNIESEFSKLNLKPALYLTEQYQQLGFTEMLVRNGYKFKSSEIWLGAEIASLHLNNISTSEIEVAEVSIDNFNDFSSVANTNWSNEPTQLPYSKICEETLSGEKFHTGVTSRFFVIYENSKPVSSAGMFYSQKDDFAYLHCGSTLPEYRGKGYQNKLIQHRLKIASELGISVAYSIVEEGSVSWSNFIKLGFNQIQKLVLLTK